MGSTMTSRITILDGGMGKELRRMGAPFRQPEWSALAMLEAPDYVAAAHDNFVQAGADVLTTNVYALVPFHIGDDRFAERGRELVALGGRLARDAADTADRPVLVAGSIPPPFGSYEPDLFDPEAAFDIWTMFVEVQAPYVDLWIGETMSSIAEAVVFDQVLDKAEGTGPNARPRWASFCLFDRMTETPDGPRALLRSGETVVQMAEAVAPMEPGAVLFNCSQPEVIGPALAELGRYSPALPIGGYANAFRTEAIDGEGYAANAELMDRRDDLTVDRYADLVGDWISVGATIVGGCCDIYPDHIAELANRFGLERPGT